MAHDSMQPDKKQPDERVTCEFERGVLKSILTEGPLGAKKKETFDADGNMSELYVERQDKTWKHDIYNNGVKVTSREFDNLAITTTVFDVQGRVTAVDEDL